MMRGGRWTRQISGRGQDLKREAESKFRETVDWL